MKNLLNDLSNIYMKNLKKKKKKKKNKKKMRQETFCESARHEEKLQYSVK